MWLRFEYPINMTSKTKNLLMALLVLVSFIYLFFFWLLINSQAIDCWFLVLTVKLNILLINKLQNKRVENNINEILSTKKRQNFITSNLWFLLSSLFFFAHTLLKLIILYNGIDKKKSYTILLLVLERQKPSFCHHAFKLYPNDPIIQIDRTTHFENFSFTHSLL